MKAKLFSLFLMVASLLLSLSAATSVRAEDLRVEHGGLYPTIQSAIDYAALQMRSPTSVSFRILVKADTKPYNGPITPINGVPIIGDSTANTFIEGGTGPLINLNNVTSVEIKNFTFQNAPVGISVANSSVINITNNVFQMGTRGTAIQVQNSTNTRIVNNTFFNNGTAISTNSDIEISNNIFSNNQLAISDQVLLRVLTYNYFYANTANGVESLDPSNIPNNRVTIQDPQFVTRSEPVDLHLLPESPAKGSGNPNYKNSFDTTSDMGAYGGPNSDNPRMPPAVTNVSTRVVSPTSIEVNWSPSSNRLVTAYRVYYRTSSDGTTQNVVVPKDSTSALFSDLPVTTPAPPIAPPGLTLTPLNQALQANWKQIPGATKYLIYYGTQSFDQASLGNAVRVDAGDTTSCPLGDLINLTPYFVAVSAQAQFTVSVSVTAVIDSTLAPDSGSDNESPLSQEVTQGIGPIVDGPISPVVIGTPEAISPYPNLPNEGCFIATAAFGFYSAPQVQVLREFRDRYLLTNAPGKAFVTWYYNNGPRGAQFINAHPWLKLPVRFALLPLIAMAMFLLSTTPLVKLVILSLALLVTLYWMQRIKVMQKYQRKMLVQNGGSP